MTPSVPAARAGAGAQHIAAAHASAHGGEAGIPLLDIVEMQSTLIDMIASGAPLRDTLTEIARTVERLAPPVLCSILLLDFDGKHLRPGAAPSLPAAFTAAVDGLEIGPSVGSCGTAAFTKQAVVVEDIGTDPKWAPARDFALSFGLRACWSLPIIRDDGIVLGTVAMYYREVRKPTARDWLLLDPAARLARLALARQRRSEQLEETEARWHLAADAAGLGTYDVDLRNMTGTWSPRFRAILGLPPDTPAERDNFVALIHPDDRDLFDIRNFAASENSPGLHDDMELRIRRADTGEERTVAVRRRILYKDGAPAHALGTMADITDQRRYEQRLAEAKFEAERANVAKSAFLASMSHELRTPLNAIIGFSDVIRQCTLGPIAPAKYREYVDDIHTSGLHLLSLINDVLDMAKIEAGKQDLKLTELAVAPTAAAILTFVEPQAKAAGVTLDVQVERGLALLADERGLTQILVNLLSNGVKFTRPGGRVTVFANRLPNGGAAIGVQDTGIGMSMEDLTTALEPFGQAHRFATVEGRGTGLGLPLVRALIKSHGAEFKIESELEKGTRVWGEFPPGSVLPARAVA